MAVTIPQTGYTLSQVAAVAGMPADADPAMYVVGEYIASEDVTPGRVVEMDPTDTTLKKCRLPRAAGTVGKIQGIVMYSAADPVGSFKSGSSVRILRRGRIYAEFTGTTGGDLLAPLNLNSSSTIATNRGKLTDAATSATVGSEIYATKMLCMEETSVSPAGLCVVELNGALT